MSLQVIEYLADKMINDIDNNTPFDLMAECLKDEYTEEETNEMTIILKDVFHKMGKPSVTTLQQNVALYSMDRPPDIQKFYRWLNARLTKVLTEEWTLKQFMSAWDKAYDSISDKMNSEQTKFTDRIGIANIVMMVNDLKGE
jgi:hypothetical protein